MIRLLRALLASLFVPVGFWLSGFDFDQRGTAALMCYLLSILVAGATILYHDG